MKRIWIALAAVGLAAGCGPTRMDATDAAPMLEQYAAGAPEAIDVCAPGGRDTLRGAVRAYGAAMAEGGEAWPDLPAPDEGQTDLTAVEVTVLISFAAGFVRSSDLQSAARARAQQLALAHLPDMMRFRGAARAACAEVVALQQAAGRYMLAMTRYQSVVEQAERRGGETAVERVRGQGRRVESARDAMEFAARAVEARMAGG